MLFLSIPYFQVFNKTTRQGIFCGTNLHDTHKSQARWLHIHFHSDLTVAGEGFNARYVQEYGKLFLYCLARTHARTLARTHARTHTHTHTHTHTEQEGMLGCFPFEGDACFIVDSILLPLLLLCLLYVRS